MRKRLYILVIVFLLIDLFFVIWKFNKNKISVFLNYNDFVVEGDTIVKYNSSGNVVIPKEINGIVIKKIGDYAFYNKDIDSIFIPDTITTIGSYAFAQNNLKSLKVPSSISLIGEGAFMNNKISDLEINNAITLGNACFNNNLLSSDEAFFYSNNKNKELISYGGFIKGNVVIDDGVEVIGEKAFYKTEIVSISIPDSVYEIKKEAFRGNNLVEVFLSNNISLIADNSFIDNNYLVNVTIDNKESSILNYPWGLDNSNILWLKK